jgi:disulfide bond formation protein DsbB
MTRVDKLRLSALLFPLGALLIAYTSQYWGKLYPCEMCWWQRYPHFAAVIIAVLSYAIRPNFYRSVLIALAAMAILTSGLIGGFHAGVEYNWWEGLTRCTAPISAGTTDFAKSIMEAPLIRCDVAPWTLFGISIAGYNFLLSSGIGIAILIGLWKTRTA